MPAHRPSRSTSPKSSPPAWRPQRGDASRSSDRGDPFDPGVSSRSTGGERATERPPGEGADRLSRPFAPSGANHQQSSGSGSCGPRSAVRSPPAERREAHTSGSGELRPAAATGDLGPEVAHPALRADLLALGRCREHALPRLGGSLPALADEDHDGRRQGDRSGGEQCDQYRLLEHRPSIPAASAGDQSGDRFCGATMPRGGPIVTWREWSSCVSSCSRSRSPTRPGRSDSAPTRVSTARACRRSSTPTTSTRSRRLSSSSRPTGAVPAARVLAAPLRTLEYDLVLAGADPSDGGGGIVPAAVAAHLGLPYL